ncbi:hypothetical protein AAE478_006386 [Parahypoxylon ruwenzoriense]
MNPASITITRTLCELCHQFISNLFSFDFARQTSYPPRWQPIGTEWTSQRAWGDCFRHRETLHDLSESAKMCELCNILHTDLAPMGSDMCQGWLGLYPFWSTSRVGENKQKGHFRAGFRESLAKMPWGSNRIGSVPLHAFKVCHRRPLIEGEQVAWSDAYKRLAAVPTTPLPSEISRIARSWQEECLRTHKNCAKDISGHELPTRVVDLGEREATHVCLYETKGEKAPYAALSHCWGGVIPAITTESNRTARTDTINFHDLPQNFQDAIRVTRALGVRYLWIDALCIIQDSKADWLREAGRMGSLYAGASVVISALDSPASTAGFLIPDRVPVAILNDEFAIQKVFPELYDYLSQCPLVRRGWCMQERLLAPRILHFGKEQMFWECYSDFKCEDGLNSTGGSSGHVMAEFMAIRKHIGISAAQGAELEWRAWYRLLEEYTTRMFTVSSDRLPALAGAAVLFKSTKPATTYVAGLWKEDIARGLLWCAHYDHVPGRKVWGISSSDRIVELTVPHERRAPSWSWAALDGQVDFWALRTDGFIAEVLNVTMRAGENEFTEAFPDGTVNLRGAIVRMFYHAPPEGAGYDVGTLTFEQADSPNDKSVALNGCVMDLDRRTSRFCFVVIVAKSNDDWYLLVLNKCDDETYQRIGMSTAHGVKVDPKRFETRIIEIR